MKGVSGGKYLKRGIWGDLSSLWPRHATSSSHTWWGSVFGSLKSQTSGDVWRFKHRSPQGIWMSRDDLVYILVLKIRRVWISSGGISPGGERSSRKIGQVRQTIKSSIFLLVPLVGVTWERRKPPQVILDVLGKQMGSNILSSITNSTPLLHLLQCFVTIHVWYIYLHFCLKFMMSMYSK